MIKIPSVLVFVGYVTYVISTVGIQKSISQSYYALKDKGYLFTIFCFLFSYPIAILASNIFITPAAILIGFVGIARAFKDNKVWYYTHMIAAYSGVILAQIGIWVYYDNQIIPVVFGLISILLLSFNVKNKIWWIEIIAFLSVIWIT